MSAVRGIPALLLPLLVGGCTTLVPDPCAEERTVTLKQGLEGYAGTEDATLQLWSPTENVGALANLQLHLNPSSVAKWRSRAFVRFELAAHVPVGAEVSSARLALHEYLHNDFKSSAETVGLHALRVRARELEATGQAYASGKSFGAPLGQPGLDFEVTPVATYAKDLALPAGGKRIDLDVTASVRSWVSAPASNNGWLLKGVSDDGSTGQGNDIHYCSAQHATADRRPKLTVVFVAP